MSRPPLASVPDTPGPALRVAILADVCSLEKIMLEAEDGVVGIILPASPRRQQAQSPWAGPSGEARACENWNWFSVLQADLPGVKRRQDGLPCKVEGAARFEEELSLFGEEDREAGQVDDLPVRFDLRKVRVNRKVRRESRRNTKLGIHPCLGIAVAGLDYAVAARPGDDPFRRVACPSRYGRTSRSRPRCTSPNPVRVPASIRL